MAKGYSYTISLKLQLVFNVTSDACLTHAFLKTKRIYSLMPLKMAFLIDVHAMNLHNTLDSKIGLVPNTAADKPDHL